MIDLPAMGRPVKRSVNIGGHSTSVSLEDAFWLGLRQLAEAEQVTVAAAIAEIDRRRPPDVGLATAIRLTVLAQAGPSSPRLTDGAAPPPCLPDG